MFGHRVRKGTSFWVIRKGKGEAPQLYGEKDS